ncbi:ganglioside GM2 activator, partial [Biomphalaria pfeifferi]
SNYIMDPLPIPLMGGALITGKYRAIIKANNFELGELLCYSLELEISPAPA